MKDMKKKWRQFSYDYFFRFTFVIYYFGKPFIFLCFLTSCFHSLSFSFFLLQILFFYSSSFRFLLLFWNTLTFLFSFFFFQILSFVLFFTFFSFFRSFFFPFSFYFLSFFSIFLTFFSFFLFITLTFYLSFLYFLSFLLGRRGSCFGGSNRAKHLCSYIKLN